MAIYRSRARRPARRPRKFIRRGRRTMRPMRSMTASRLNVHHFKRTFQSADIAFNSAGASAGAYAPALSNMPNYTEFTALFDMYRINKVVVKFVPSFTGSDANPAATANALPNLYSVTDNDDNATPANLDELLQYPGLKLTRANQIHTRVFTPCVGVDAAGITGIAPKYKQWINCSSPSIVHYGMKYWLDAIASTTGKYRIFITMYFSCKAVR